jgi:fatty acid desaturase
MRERRVEWPTIAVAVAIAAGFAATLSFHQRLPAVAEIVVVGILAAWYGSLQHEVIHGHPTPWRSLNTALAIVPLALVVPFRSYRTHHLAHHQVADLTDPDDDPESWYVSAETWATAGSLQLWYLRATRTLLGRLVLGPPVVAARWLATGMRNVRTPSSALHAAGHVLAAATVLAVVRAAGLSWWTYVVGVVWVGGALTMLRSFAEHRMTATGPRSAIVRTGRFFSLLYLNNNLHHTHHVRPGLPWFELTAADAELAAHAEVAAGAGLYAGYSEVARRYLLRPFDTPVRSSTDRSLEDSRPFVAAEIV